MMKFRDSGLSTKNISTGSKHASISAFGTVLGNQAPSPPSPLIPSKSTPASANQPQLHSVQSAYPGPRSLTRGRCATSSPACFVASPTGPFVCAAMCIMLSIISQRRLCATPSSPCSSASESSSSTSTIEASSSRRRSHQIHRWGLNPTCRGNSHVDRPGVSCPYTVISGI